MTRIIRTILAAAALAALTTTITHAQAGPATVSFTDPNCASWAMTQSGSTFTLTCQNLTCSIAAVPANPQPSEAVMLTATCNGSPTAYTWSQMGGPAACPAYAGINFDKAAFNAPNVTVLGCVYRVAAVDPANGGGNALVTLNWSSGPPPTPTGCVVAIVPTPNPLLNAGGSAALSVTSCTPSSGLTYNWTRNVTAGVSTSSSFVDPLAAGGTAGYTNTYSVQVCNGTSCATFPTVAGSITAFVPGTSGGGGGVNLTGCAAAGFTGKSIDLAYPTGANTSALSGSALPSGSFGNSDALVVRFTTPAQGVNDQSVFQPAGLGVTAQTNRLYTLATTPCQFATASTAYAWPPAGIIYSIVSGSPQIVVHIGACASLPQFCTGFGTYLQPNTTYYITMVNRNNFVPAGLPSCSLSDCPMRMDWNN